MKSIKLIQKKYYPIHNYHLANVIIPDVDVMIGSYIIYMQLVLHSYHI